MKQDITKYNDLELSLMVFNDESLYNMLQSDRKQLLEIIQLNYIYTDDQWANLIHDINTKD